MSSESVDRREVLFNQHSDSSDGKQVSLVDGIITCFDDESDDVQELKDDQRQDAPQATVMPQERCPSAFDT